MLLSKCTVCDTQKIEIYQESSILLSIETLVSKIPVLDEILF